MFFPGLRRGKYFVNVNYYQKDTSASNVRDVYACCKGDCGRLLRRRGQDGLMDGWNDISDLVIPLNFIRNIMAFLNRLRDGIDTYTDEAFGKEKEILMAFAQKVLRETSESERQRVRDLMQYPF